MGSQDVRCRCRFVYVLGLAVCRERRGSGGACLAVMGSPFRRLSMLAWFLVLPIN